MGGEGALYKNHLISHLLLKATSRQNMIYVIEIVGKNTFEEYSPEEYCKSPSSFQSNLGSKKIWPLKAEPKVTI